MVLKKKTEFALKFPVESKYRGLTSCSPISILGLAEEFMLGKRPVVLLGKFLNGVCGYAKARLGAQSGGEIMAMMT